MKVFSWRKAAVAMVLVTASSQALAWGGRGKWRGGYGHHHRSSSNLWIGGAALLGAGALIGWSASRPSYSSSVYVGSGYAPSYGYGGYGGYYGPAVTYLAPPVYVQPPVTYVAPPVVYGTPAPQYVQPTYETQRVARYNPVEEVIAYPAKGQNQAQQSRDREACRNWAMNQSGFDPSFVTTYTTVANTDSYQRALGACFKGRGYSIN